MTKTKRTDEIVREIIERGSITEREIKLLQKRANAAKVAPDFDYKEITLADAEQTQKGVEWLRKQQRRKESPFGYREDSAIDNFTHFTFDGFLDAGNAHHRWFVPLYTCHGYSATFQYYMSGGEPVIVG